MSNTLDQHVPFAAIVLPWAEQAFASMPQHRMLAETARNDLRFALIERMASIVSHALLIEFRAQSARYDTFVSKMADEARFRAFLPVGARLLETVADQWVTVTHELVQRLAADECVVAEVFGSATKAVSVEHVTSFLGDPHRGGRSVMKLTDSTGQSAFYKPRSVAQEHRFFALHRQLQANFGADVADLVVVPRDGYGWMSEVRSSSISDPTSYWRAAGRMTALASLAGATDLHNENVIATAYGPVPIDLECADQPLIWSTESPQPDAPPRLDMTVMTTGLLPNHYRENTSVALELCGLLALPNQSGGSWRSEWAGLGTDAIGSTQRLSSWGAPANRPVDKAGRQVPADVSAIVRGFEESLDFLTAPGSPIDDWQALPSRILFRETMEYMDILSTLTAPDALANAAVFEARLEALPSLPTAAQTALGNTALRDLERSERSALAQLDVPLHEAHGQVVRFDDGTTAEGVRESATHRFTQRQGRGRTSFGAAESTLIRLVCEQHEKVHVSLDHQPLPSPESVHGVDFVRAAVAIGEQLLRDNVGTTQAPCWLTPTGAPPRRSATFNDVSLYSGRTGIGIFFAALASITSDERWIEAATGCVRPIDDSAPWFDIGTSGSAYATALVSQASGDAAMERTAVKKLLEIEGLPAPTDELDMINGWGGVIAVHLALIEATRHPELCDQTQDLLGAYVEALDGQLESRIDGHTRAQPGHAHGIAGIASLLDRAGRTLANPSLGDYAHDLWTKDLARSRARKNLAGRLHGRGEETVATTTWCWGGAGVLHGLATSSVDKTAVASIVDATMPALVEERPDHQHLCCGEAGRALCLQRVGAGFERSDAAVHAQQLGASLATRVLQGKPIRAYTDTTVVGPGLFFGLAGIGYALCRLAAPHLVADVLAIELEPSLL